MTPLLGLGGAVVSHVDITRRKRAELELSRVANRDALTGVLNRRALDDGDVSGPAVLFIDLDEFKAVNDRLGHATGDEILARVANRILHQIRPADRVARIGGDEFVVILGDTGGEESTGAIAARIEDAVAASYQVGPDVVRIGASVGIAHGTPGEPIADVVARADRAMYEVKRSHAPRRRAATGRSGAPPGPRRLRSGRARRGSPGGRRGVRGPGCGPWPPRPRPGA